MENIIAIACIFLLFVAILLNIAYLRVLKAYSKLECELYRVTEQVDQLFAISRNNMRYEEMAKRDSMHQ